MKIIVFYDKRKVLSLSEYSEGMDISSSSEYMIGDVQEVGAKLRGMNINTTGALDELEIQLHG